MHIRLHEKACIEEFGNPYMEVHLKLDQYFDEFLWYHRTILHHRLGVDLLAKEMGEEVRGPAEQHIRLDLEGIYPDDWSHFVLHTLLPPRVWTLQKKKVRKLYGWETFDMVQTKMFLASR